MEFILVAAFAVAAAVMATIWILTGDPTAAVVIATTASVAVLAVGDVRRQARRPH